MEGPTASWRVSVSCLAYTPRHTLTNECYATPAISSSAETPKIDRPRGLTAQAGPAGSARLVRAGRRRGGSGSFADRHSFGRPELLSSGRAPLSGLRTRMARAGVSTRARCHGAHRGTASRRGNLVLHDARPNHTPSLRRGEAADRVSLNTWRAGRIIARTGHRRASLRIVGRRPRSGGDGDGQGRGLRCTRGTGTGDRRFPRPNCFRPVRGEGGLEDPFEGGGRANFWRTLHGGLGTRSTRK